LTEKSNPVKSNPAPHISRSEWLLVVASCAAASIAAILWSWLNNAMLNYGDAVAHLHIARRVFDAHQPRLTELGSVWLPLPHLLLIPFVQIYSWWASGWAGVIPSALAYLAACAGIYRLARHWLAPAPSALALAFFALNPNLLYLQTTAMTEPLFICEMVWVAVWLVEWRASLDSSLQNLRRLHGCIALVLVAAVFTRYDGWIMALVAWACMGLALAHRRRLRLLSFWIASLLLIAAPITWLIYNSVNFGDWLYFLRGPYSAKAIEIRTSVPGFPPHPGWYNPWVALIFYIKAAELDAAALAWGNTLLTLSLLGTAWAWLTARKRAFTWALLLWFPAAFYAYSVSYGSVPIFLPIWWPHSWYNLRYGMELLPAFALSLGFSAQIVLSAVNEFKPRAVNPWWERCAALALFALIALNAAQILRERPQVYVEGTKIIEARRPYDEQIPPALRALLAGRPGAVVLMDTSVYPEIVAFTGIPLHQTINESDLEIYRAALAAPAAHAAIVLAFDGDEIDRAVKAHPQNLTALRHFSTPGKPSGTLYVSGTPVANSRQSRAKR
jgi:4-amino-4-deoxy-L-arabinose transferase-like glycosyltransferase